MSQVVKDARKLAQNLERAARAAKRLPAVQAGGASAPKPTSEKILLRRQGL